jgi:cyclic beta-1,2-glucan synthetase
LRADEATLGRSTLGQEGLWRFGISGDLPLVLVRVQDGGDAQLVRQVLQSHESWRLKGLQADVVILNEHAVSYRDELHEQLADSSRKVPGAPGVIAGGVPSCCAPTRSRRPRRSC